MFWNQLYRLSQQPELCKQLVEFLPKSLTAILEQLQIPHFAKFFEKTSNNGEQFFQELSEAHQ